MHGSVSVTQAATLLADAGDPVDRSTLSRYVTKHADALLPEKRGRETVLDFERLLQHRRENIRLGPQAPRDPLTKARARSDEAAENIRAQRQLRELDIAERVGDLTPKIEVDEAARFAISALRTSFSLALNDTAETIASISGVEARHIRPHLRTFEKKGLDAFIRVLADYNIPQAEAAAS